MPPPDKEDSLSHNEGDVDKDQPKHSLDDMDETTREGYASSVDSMATASTMRPSAVPDHSTGPTSFPRNIDTKAFDTDDARVSDTESSLGGAVTPRCGQLNSDYLFSGTGGSSGQKIADADIVHFEADIEGILGPQRTESFTPFDIRKAFQYPQAGPLSSMYGPYPIHFKSHVFDRLDRRSSGSSTLTSEPPGLTNSSRTTTFSDMPFFDEATNQMLESPVNTPGIGQRVLEFKDSGDVSQPQDITRLSGAMTKEPTTYKNSPLSRSLGLRLADATQYDDYRSPQPPVSDSGESEDDEGTFNFERRSLPSGLNEDDDDSGTSDSECSDQPEDFDENHPLFDIKAAVVRQSLLEYKNWKTSASGETGNSNSAPQQSTARPNAETSPAGRGSGKRARQESQGDDNNDGKDEDGDGPPQKKPALSPAGTANAPDPLFACPFAKKDPIKYESCFSLKLTKIKNIKQHLRRAHEAPVYCPSCRNIFEEEEDLESHLRDQTRCETSDKPIPEGMTPSQRKKLEKRVKSRVLIEQWYEIYDILFEGAPRPRSPYIPAGLNEKLRGFMDMMHERGHQIIMENITKRELMRRLEEMGLQADEDEEQMISSLLSASITDGLQEITNAWKTNFANEDAVPSLTEGDTILSSTNPIEDECLPSNSHYPSDEGLNAVPGTMGTSPFVPGNITPQDTGLNDSIVFCPDGSSMQTPNLNGGEFIHVDPNISQLMDNKVMDSEMWERYMQPYGAEQGRPI